ncbi:protein FAR1-RELATED SEQUENCE 5-like [Triticum dicoccoides]|uniref:protein FAR1-RELATED SEQUENCE 5-like n=1 Tax=Triticum dicoccoides TaxID=85692 RepID=UPI0018909979|nr:protein FAR1-RELATED SEQUENCE 5-like [Triticum dicoccoides]XP_037412256.1 protein FAR1-RELATED SEQUENCE 5-like [Triticum dicoccoides]XP_037412257.1 protein FAR1-RELATED SEQUENCE 5-like [Triticum dicoccoides]
MCTEHLTTREEVNFFCNEVLSLAENCDYSYERNYDSEDSDEDSVACAGSEDYVFPTPEEADRASRPEVGIVFSTLDESLRFANVYAQLNVFAVIKGRNYKNRKLYFQCNKGRKRPSANSGLRKRKRNIIEGTNCPMNIIVKLVDDKWHIASVSLQHNHDLVSSPSLTKIFLSHRNMNEEEIMLSKLLQEQRVKPRRIMSIFRRLCGGKLGNNTFDVKKLDNLKQGERIRKKENTDIEWTLQYIDKLQIDTPGFCYRLQRDTDNTVLGIFWTDARFRLNYRLFGKIISFDTTYSTNKYNMPFAPIVGINGHGRTIVFGWALLQDETSDTFEWIFQTFMEVMQWKKPGIILTDQDAGMKAAIPKVFPYAIHRFCLWHIFKNVRENMSAFMATREKMEKHMMKCLL